MEHNESEGTNKIFSVSSLLLGVLAHGAILFFDEFDARLHPLLTRRLLEMFHGQNKHNAQLIVVSHDTNLLSPELLRRDQIWFAEKEKNGATRLTSLAEFKKIRKGESYERNYIDGRYGAIPYLGDFSSWEK
jgi:AAA15 family ATPase/GTPase